MDQSVKLKTVKHRWAFNDPFPKQRTLDSPKLKDFADYNIKCHENGRKFSKLVENTVEKGEIAHYEQFLLFPQCFQKTRKNQGLFWKGLCEMGLNAWAKMIYPGDVTLQILL